MTRKRRSECIAVFLTVLVIAAPVSAATHGYGSAPSSSSIDGATQSPNGMSDQGIVSPAANTLLSQSLTESVRLSPPADDLSLAPGGTYPILVSVKTEDGGIFTEDKLSDPTLTVSVEGGNATIAQSVSSDTDYPQQTTLSDSTVEFQSDSFFRAKEGHTAIVWVRVPDTETTGEVTVTATTGTGSEQAATYTIAKSGTSQAALARSAERRATVARGYQDTYHATLNHEPWNDTYRTAMQDGLTTAAIEGTKSRVVGGVPYVGTADDLKTVYDMGTGEYQGGTVGQINRITLKLNENLFSRVETAPVKRAGNASTPLDRLITLYEKEATAWRNGNTEKAQEYLLKQRAILYDACGNIGPYRNYPDIEYDQCLITEAGDQRQAARGDDVQNYFAGLEAYGLAEYEHISEDLLPLARDPQPRVTTERDATTLQNDLSTLEENETMDVTFVVSNAEGGGATTKQGYLSMSHADSLDVVSIENTSGDAERPRVVQSAPGDPLVTAEGEQIDAVHPLVDIYEGYEPGETNVYTVTLEKTETDSDAWIAYRAAFDPVISNDSQAAFARYPNGDTYPTDQQQWPVINLTAADESQIDNPPVASLSISKLSVTPGESVTLDTSDATDDGTIETRTLQIDTDADGIAEQKYNAETVETSFTATGTKRVTVELTDDAGQTSTVTRTLTVEPQETVRAGFTVDRSYITPANTTTFIATTAADSYQWDFTGDGTVDRTGKQVTYRFAESGQQTITLSVANTSGESDTTTTQLTVAPLDDRIQKPTAVIDGPSVPTTGTTVTFDGSDSTDRRIEDDGSIVDGTITSYEWDLDGDNQTEQTGVTAETAFETSGPTTVSLTVTDDEGGTATATRVVNVTGATNETTDEQNVTAPQCSGVSYSGDGTTTDPYTVSTVAQLQCIGAHDLDAQYRLVTDLDAGDTAQWHNGSGFIPIGTPQEPFTGSFNGSGHTIANLSIDRTSEGENDIGLFGSVNSGSVANLRLTAVDIDGRYNVGAVTGVNRGTITNVSVTGTVTADAEGGGITGINHGTVTTSYATAAVDGPAGLGGLVGYNRGSVQRAYAAGAVSDDYDTGGLVGYGDGTVTDAYWDTNRSGLQTSAGGTGLTTAAMTGESARTNLTALDFTSTWQTRANGYPVLVANTNTTDAGTEPNSSVITVDDDSQSDYETIQAAVRNAPDNATISVQPGTYREEVEIGKNVTLIAPDGAVLNGSTIETSQYSSPDAFTIQPGPHAPTIDGFTVTEYGTGVSGYKANGSWIVRNSTFVDLQFEAVKGRYTTGDWRVENATIRDLDGDGVDGFYTDGDWHVENTTIVRVDQGITAYSAAGEWSVQDTRIERPDGQGISARQATGNWSVRNLTVSGARTGIEADSTTGDWLVSQSTLQSSRETNFDDDGVRATDATGDWAVRQTTIRNISDSGIAAPETTGEWSVTNTTIRETGVGIDATQSDGDWQVTQSRIVDSNIGLDATSMPRAGTATNNWWGATDGPSGDFDGSGTPVYDNVSVAPYYTDFELTTLSTNTSSELDLRHSKNRGSAVRSFTGETWVYSERMVITPGGSRTLSLGNGSSPSLRVVRPAQNASVVVTPEQGTARYNVTAVTLDIYRPDGTLKDEPTLLVEPAGGGLVRLPVSVRGDTDVFSQTATNGSASFGAYSVELLEESTTRPTDSTIIASTDTRIYGIGYAGILQQNSTTGTIEITVPRDAGVNSSWHADYVVQDAGGVVRSKSVAVDTATEQFRVTINASTLANGTYRQALVLSPTADAQPGERIVRLFGTATGPSNLTVGTATNDEDVTVETTVDSPVNYAGTPLQLSVQGTGANLTRLEVTLGGTEAVVSCDQSTTCRGTPTLTPDHATWNGSAYEETNIEISAETDTGVVQTKTVRTKIRMPGDVTGDGVVDIRDAARLGQNWRTTAADAEYDPAADLNNNGAVDIFDIVLLGQYWRETAEEYTDNETAS